MNTLPPTSLPFAPGAPERRPRLLVVDDQPANVQAIYQAFCADHQVLMATSGEQALAVCAANPPDLVLLDVVMPGMDGHEVCRRLKTDEATRDIPVIFVTANDDPASEADGLDLGAADFICKPINPKVVRARVRAQLLAKAHTDLLRQWVYIDGLTGVYNRRHFDEHLRLEWSRGERTGKDVSLVMIDVDHFKRYNDFYGHQAGDDCLRQVTEAFRYVLRRPADMLSRYGGEEFACLLPDTDTAGALHVAQALLDQVEQARIEHAASPVAPVVTVSIGVASLRGTGAAAAAELLAAADAQLYRAKSEGRNRVCSADETRARVAAFTRA